jgi:hypothetical protein
MKFTVAAAAFLLPLLAAATADAKGARCAITADDGGSYRGPCSFAAEGKGSFTVTPSKSRFLMGEITALSVAIVGPGLAEVRGLTRDGINSRWGEARRSRRDKACWDGETFRICVY